MAERGSYRWIGLALFVGVSWLYAASGLMAPIWAVGVLWVLWLGSLVYLIRVWRSDSRKVLAVPFVAAVIWTVVMLAGVAVLDWAA